MQDLDRFGGLLLGVERGAGEVVELHAPPRPAPRVGAEEPEGTAQPVVRGHGVQRGEVLLRGDQSEVLPQLEHADRHVVALALGRRAQLLERRLDGLGAEVRQRSAMRLEPPQDLRQRVGVPDPGEADELQLLLDEVQLSGVHRLLGEAPVQGDAAVVDPLVRDVQLPLVGRPAVEPVRDVDERVDVLDAVVLEPLPVLRVVRRVRALTLAVGDAELPDEVRARGVLLLSAERLGEGVERLGVAVLGGQRHGVLPLLRRQVLAHREVEEPREAHALELGVVGDLQHVRVAEVRDRCDLLGAQGEARLTPVERPGGHEDVEVRVRRVAVDTLLDVRPAERLDVDVELRGGGVHQIYSWCRWFVGFY